MPRGHLQATLPGRFCSRPIRVPTTAHPSKSIIISNQIQPVMAYRIDAPVERGSLVCRQGHYRKYRGAKLGVAASMQSLIAATDRWFTQHQCCPFTKAA